MRKIHLDRRSAPARGTCALGRLGLALGLLLGLLALGSPARAATYYEANAPYRFGTGSDSFGEGVDTATGAFQTGGTFAAIPGRVPIHLAWHYNSHDGSPGPMGTGTSLSVDWFIAPSAVLGAGWYELQAPGNRRFAFRDQASNGIYVNVTDPEVLGAQLTFASPPDGLAGTLRWKDGTRFLFNAEGELYRIETRHGNYLTITRNASGFATAITQPSGRGVTLTYGGPNGKLSSVTLPLSRTWQVAYDGSNRFQRVTDPTGAHSDWTWTTYTRGDSVVLPLIVTEADRTGAVQVTNAYDTSGRVTSQTFADAGVLTAAYSAALGTSGYTTVTDPRNNVTRTDFTWNPHRFGYLVTSEIDALGRTTTYGRTGPSYLITSVTDFRNRTVSAGWDHSKGNRTSLTKPTVSGGTVAWTYQYEPTFSQLTQVTDPLNRQTVSTVDPTTGNTTAVRDAKNFTTSFSFASNGDLLSTTNALNQTTSFTYSADHGDLLTVTNPLNHQTSFGYDSASRRISVTDANGKVTQTAFDVLDRVTSVTKYLGATPVVTSFQHDPEGRLRFLTNALNRTWEWQRDAKGREVAALDPLGFASQRAWDKNNNLLVFQDRKGQRHEYSYGTGDRLLAAVFKRGDGSTESSYTVNWNATTHLVDSVVDSVAGTFTWSYDSLDRVLSESCYNGTCTYTWDDLDRRTVLQTSGQDPVRYTFDERDDVATITQDRADPLEDWTTTLTYDALGRLIRTVLPNQVTTERAFDAAGRMTSNNTLGHDTNLYTHDAVGNVLSHQKGWTPRTYQYDDLYRLVQTDGPGYDYVWSYDLVGNRLSETRTNWMQYRYTEYSYNAANRLTAVNGNACHGRW